MSKTSNTKQITKIVIDEANGLTHVYMSDLSPKIVKANTSAPTNIPTKSEFSFRDESVESQAVVEKAFDEVFPEEDGHPQLFCPICFCSIESSDASASVLSSSAILLSPGIVTS